MLNYLQPRPHSGADPHPVPPARTVSPAASAAMLASRSSISGGPFTRHFNMQPTGSRSTGWPLTDRTLPYPGQTKMAIACSAAELAAAVGTSGFYGLFSAWKHYSVRWTAGSRVVRPTHMHLLSGGGLSSGSGCSHAHSHFWNGIHSLLVYLF